jgi:hypothetical protein
LNQALSGNILVKHRIFQFLGLAIVAFAGWRTPIVLSNVLHALKNPQADHRLAVEGVCLLMVFFAVGLLLIAVPQHILRRTQAAKKALAEHPNEPWLARPDWASGRMRLSSRAPFWASSIFALMYFLIVLPGAMVLAQNKAAAWFIYTVTGLIGIVLLVFVRVAWMNRKWNRSELEILTLPGIIGGPFEAVAHIPEVLSADTKYLVRLECVQAYRHTDTSKGSAKTFQILWSKEVSVVRGLSGGSEGALTLPISIGIDYKCLPTDSSKFRCWKLSISPKELIQSREAVFEVPVYRTELSDPNYIHDDAPVLPFVGKTGPEEVLQKLGCISESIVGGGQRYRFSIYHIEGLMFMGLVLAVCLGLHVASWWIMPWTFKGIALAVTGLACWGALNSLAKLLFWYSTLDFYPNWLEASAGWKFWDRQVRWERGEIFDVDYPRVKSRLVHSQGQPLETWEIEIGTENSAKPLLVIQRIRGRTETEILRAWLEDQIKKSLGPWIASPIEEGDDDDDDEPRP